MYVSLGMSESDTVHIFHVTRRDGSEFFLHPFTGDESTLAMLERQPIEGLYGAEPEVSTLTALRDDLYRVAERAIRRWDAEARFVPRFLISAALFVVSFLFFSIVIRDPLPVLDELLISFVLAAALYTALRRHGRLSEAVERKRIAVQRQIDAIMFSESDTVRHIESQLQLHESSDDPLRAMRDQRELAFKERDLALVAEALRYLAMRFRGFGVRRQGRHLMRSERVNLERVQKWADSRGIDLLLFTFYLRLRREVESAATHSRSR